LAAAGFFLGDFHTAEIAAKKADCEIDRLSAS
jgi:hypothetical protein